MTQLFCIHFKQREYKIIFAIIRLTYGYNKKTAEVTYWKLQNLTNIRRDVIPPIMDSLISRNILSQIILDGLNRGQKRREIGINKDYESWEKPSYNPIENMRETVHTSSTVHESGTVHTSGTVTVANWLHDRSTNRHTP